MNNIFLNISIFAGLFVIIMIIRSILIYKYCMKKFDEANILSKKLIDQGGDFLAPYRDFEKSVDYQKMLFQFQKWTFKAFFK